MDAQRILMAALMEIDVVRDTLAALGAAGLSPAPLNMPAVRLLAEAEALSAEVLAVKLVSHYMKLDEIESAALLPPSVKASAAEVVRKLPEGAVGRDLVRRWLTDDTDAGIVRLADFFVSMREVLRVDSTEQYYFSALLYKSALEEMMDRRDMARYPVEFLNLCAQQLLHMAKMIETFDPDDIANPVDAAEKMRDTAARFSEAALQVATSRSQQAELRQMADRAAAHVRSSTAKPSRKYRM